MIFPEFNFPKIQSIQYENLFKYVYYMELKRKHVHNTYWKSHDTYLLTIDGILRYTKVIEHMSKINGIYVFVQVPGLTST